jgi:hypothetical protein
MTGSDPAVEDERPQRGRRVGRFGAVVTLASALVVGAAVLLVAGTRPEATFPPDSAEAVFQGYLDAWDAGNVEIAYAALSAKARARISLAEFREVHDWSGDAPVRVWIEGRRDVGGEVVLELTVEQAHGGLLGPDRQRYQPTVTLIRQDDAWKIDTPLVGYETW